MQTNIHFWSCLAQFFSEWEMFETRGVEKIKTHISCSVTFLRKSWSLWDNVERYCRSGQAAYDNTALRTARWIPHATNTHSKEVILISHCNNGCTIAPQRHVIRTYIACLVLGLWHSTMDSRQSSYAVKCCSTTIMTDGIWSFTVHLPINLPDELLNYGGNFSVNLLFLTSWSGRRKFP